ncbi:MAG TPA: serine/threonine-protein kinase [Actinomycetes bacterium]|jgi:serine/threonine-protein kinase|nr:serine/threonine-protein kinase [Actinomycetes bacterium]
MNRTTLASRYRLEGLIATGGMGSVYRAVDEHLGRPVAIKVLKRVLADEPMFLERFRREARAAAMVNHPNVARVFDYGERVSEPFIVMELVEGETLAERIDRQGRLPWREAFAIAEQVARALEAAHAHGVVHRDVKPANILVDGSGNVKVTDFGIARAAQATTLTRPGMVLGSANYVAPEQAQGNTVGPAADLYSLGCVLFEAVTGSTPYQGPNAVAIATQHVSGDVPDPREHVPGLPPVAAELVMRPLQKAAEERFPSGAAMAEALAAANATGRAPRRDDPTLAMPVASWAASPAWADVPAERSTPPLGWRAAAPPGGRAGQGVRAAARRRVRQRAWWAAGLALGLAALLALPLVVSRQGDHPPSSPAGGVSPVSTTSKGSGSSATLSSARVPVPALAGERLAEATARLRSLDLKSELRFVNAGRQQRGRVVAQDPAPGASVERGTTVELVIGARGSGNGKGRGED